jgi:sensor c-di-GMP phosphodiesterase-like protein
MGCHLVQGWHLGRAIPTEEFLPWLAARQQGDVAPALHVV